MSLGWGDGAWGSNGWGGTLDVTGNAAAGAVGTVVYTREIALSGIDASGSVGSTAALFPETGLGDAATGYVGSVESDRVIALSGIEISAEVGTVTHARPFELSGVEANGYANAVIVPIPSNQADGAVGSVSFGLTLSLSGISAAATVGSVSTAPRQFSVTGVQANGAVGSTIAAYWQLIDDTQDANWQNITTDETADWLEVTT
jgi:hypothetical protein